MEGYDLAQMTGDSAGESPKLFSKAIFESADIFIGQHNVRFLHQGAVSYPGKPPKLFFKVVWNHADNYINHLNRVHLCSLLINGRLCGEVAHFFICFDKSL